MFDWLKKYKDGLSRQTYLCVRENFCWTNYTKLNFQFWKKKNKQIN